VTPGGFWKAVDRADAALGLAAGALLFAMMALTFVDVVGRYLFNRSVPGGFEITEIMMAVLIFAGLPLVSRRDEHVSVDLIDHALSPRVRRAQRTAIELASGALLLALAWLMWLKANDVAANGDTTTVLLIRYAPYVYAISVFLALTGLVHLLRCFVPPPERPRAAGDGG
jgi:TRAP-type C4-dicarboxylate transport system permease small subunit